ncbi:MAG: beta strand repeat-containing protein, partial [Burkholderiaceae bacterium]
MGSFSGLTAGERDDLTTYFASVISTPSVSVAYHGTTADVPLNLTHDAAPISMYTSISYSSIVGGTVATGTDVTGTSTAGGYPIKEYTAAYTHTANNCSAGSFVATATGPGGTSTGRTVNVTVTAPAAPNISTSATTSSPAYNTLISIPVTSSGGPIASIAVTSGLSHGGTLTPVGTTSFNYTSNSAAYFATDSFTYRATGPCGATSGFITVNISISAPPTPVITSSLTASGSTGNVFGGYTIAANNLPTSFNATSLPPGLSINTSTGAITGTPTANGTFNTSISATNSSGTDTKTLVFTISLTAPSITSVLTASGATGVVFGGYTITATNSPTSFNATTLPPGLSINTSTGAITGTPTLNGTYNTSISATNATATDTKTLVFTISLSAPSVTSANTASGSTGAAFSYTITGSNIPTSFNASGLPPGLSVNTGTGAITGTPTSGGVYNATVSVTNATSTGNLPVTMSITGTGNVSQTVPFNTATAINLSVSGPFTQINIATPPAHGTAPTPAAASSIVTYTPTVGYFGTDSFTYTATGPGGTSAPSTVSITVSTLIPTAGAGTMTVPVNTATTVDLAPFVTGSGLTGVSIATQGAHGTVTNSGATSVTYTPVNNYFGTDTFTYLAYGNAGTSATPGVITVTVTGRPNPTLDPNVTGLINAQIETTRRFTHAQVANFTGRLESLHRVT